MSRIITFLVAFLLIVYGAWPYYSIFRLDRALSEPDPAAIAPFVDLPAIRQSLKQRLAEGVRSDLPQGTDSSNPFVDLLAQGLSQIGDRLLEQGLDLTAVRNLLQATATQATDRRPAYFIAGIHWAFFSAWNRFEIRLGEGDNATRILMQLEGVSWRITDIGG
ncbi:hypothetical protein ThidrDRAFT_2254 [Thiorhodococcus drewsii AZ1]|uniref:DUF2939 domain-containing protein n=1 Tax=Thiorhodococcus drewsii AZ1 TaxID=765913 RepID=G2E1U1_9GAMM|nr:DUF2939 domain-containing protein [Thiorhodococcus drewsii]EGV31149.1 hypothetical protein ThidrDRAFT_2254 [Thiorhodococcus drewsii AZ1]